MDQNVHSIMVAMQGGVCAGVAPAVDEVVAEAASKAVAALGGLNYGQAQQALYVAQEAIRAAAVLPR